MRRLHAPSYVRLDAISPSKAATYDSLPSHRRTARGFQAKTSGALPSPNEELRPTLPLVAPHNALTTNVTPMEHVSTPKAPRLRFHSVEHESFVQLLSSRCTVPGENA